MKYSVEGVTVIEDIKCNETVLWLRIRSNGGGADLCVGYDVCLCLPKVLLGCLVLKDLSC